MRVSIGHMRTGWAGALALAAAMVATAGTGAAAAIEVRIPEAGGLLPSLPPIVVGGAAFGCATASGIPLAGPIASEACTDALLPIAVGQAPRDLLPGVGRDATTASGGNAAAPPAVGEDGGSADEAPEEVFEAPAQSGMGFWLGAIAVALLVLLGAFLAGRASGARRTRNAAEPAPGLAPSR